MIDITYIIMAIILLAVGIATAFVIPYLRNRIGADKWDAVVMWTTIAVEAAEQMWQESGMGEKKKAYVKDFLNGLGYNYDAEKIDALIEAIVYETT